MIELERGEEIELYGSRIAVKVVADTTFESAAGLVLPETSKRTPVRGTVVAAGPQSKIPAGASVLFRPRIGTDYTLGGEPYQIMLDRDVATVFG